jgi:hypothetical protein
MVNGHFHYCCSFCIVCSILQTLHKYAPLHQTKFVISLSSLYPRSLSSNTSFLFSFHGPSNRHSKILWNILCTLAKIQISHGCYSNVHVLQ